jgi:hypothetical protein
LHKGEAVGVTEQIVGFSRTLDTAGEFRLAADGPEPGQDRLPYEGVTRGPRPLGRIRQQYHVWGRDFAARIATQGEKILAEVISRIGDHGLDMVKEGVEQTLAGFQLSPVTNALNLN